MYWADYDKVPVSCEKGKAQWAYHVLVFLYSNAKLKETLAYRWCIIPQYIERGIVYENIQDLLNFKGFSQNNASNHTHRLC
jgi:hypothetical protein